jgi:hypothetical protein
MNGKPPSARPPRSLGPEAKAAFLAGLREGLCREDAAAAAGFSLTGFYGARRRDPVFAADWSDALALPPAAERRARAYEQRGEVRISGANRRLLQRRRRRHVRFTAERREIYVTRLAETCDSVAAAEAAGVHPSTARLHRRLDPGFDEVCGEALAEGYVFLETEIVRLRLAAQKRLRAAIDRAHPAPSETLLAEEAAEFDRIMKLLNRFDRKHRRPDARAARVGRRPALTFDQSLAALEKALDHLDIPPLEMPRKAGAQEEEAAKPPSRASRQGRRRRRGRRPPAAGSGRKG